MPKRLIDEDKPRRAAKGAVAATPGFLMRAVMYSPKDFMAASVAFAAICAIVGNAIFMQAGRHPSPWFGTPAFSNAATPAIPNPLPRPRPLEAVQPGEKALDSRLFDSKPAEIRAQPKADIKSDPRPEPRTDVAPAPRADAVPAPRLEATPTPAPRAEHRSVQRHGDPLASLIRNTPATRPAPPPHPVVAASNPNIPRPPASVPMRGDPVGDLIAGRSR